MEASVLTNPYLFWGDLKPTEHQCPVPCLADSTLGARAPACSQPMRGDCEHDNVSSVSLRFLTYNMRGGRKGKCQAWPPHRVEIK